MTWAKRIVGLALLAAMAGLAAPAVGLAQTNPTGPPKLSPVRVTWARRIIGGLLLVAVAGLALPAMSFGRAGPTGLPRWSAPTVVDRVAPTAQGLPITGVSCPSSSLCVAVDRQGELLTTTAPTRPAEWHAIRLSVPRGRSAPPVDQLLLRSVTCPSIHLCVALGGGHYLFVSRHPRGPTGAWHRIRLGRSGQFSEISSVSCATARFCVAVELRGLAFVTTDPAGGARAWRDRRVLPVHSQQDVVSIACPTAHFCAALGDVHTVFTTTHPLKASQSWRQRAVGQSTYALSCPSAHLCVVIDSNRSVYVSTRPAAGA